jgi:flagellar protein FlaG
MDNINTQIGQKAAREQASILTEKSFVSSNLVGTNSGVSDFTKSENAAVIQQVKQADKTLVTSSNKTPDSDDKKLKANSEIADIESREESVSFLESLGDISELLQTNGTKLSFALDESAGSPVVVVVDKQSGNVIRQIPSEEMQKFAERVKELESDPSSTSGLVVDRQA